MSQAFKFASRLKELRVHLCQSGASSKGVREFIEKHYVGLKSSNPRFPILIRECSGVQPVLWARYDKGKECCENLTDLSADQVLQKIRSVAQ